MLQYFRLVIAPPIRTLAAVLAATALILLLPPAPAAASAPLQTVDGTIALPLRFATDPTYSSWSGGQRQLYTLAGSNGHVGYTIELPEEVGGGAFNLSVLSGLTGLEDLDVAFYSSFNPVVTAATIANRGRGGESGVIPEGSRYAVITMFDGANVKLRFTAFAPEPAGGDVGPRFPPALPASPGVHPSFGHDGDRAQYWAKRLKRRSHVVIAVVDTGINPYHLAYRRPEYAVHPSLYIDGFPADTPALGLTFGNDYTTARGTDDAPVWSQVQERKLYWIPGTNIIGAYSAGDVAGTPPGGLPSRPIIDDDGHGTGTTSVAAGAGLSSRGAPFGSNPEALIVILEGLGDEAVKWASEQPWIDFISGSYGDPLSVPCNDSVDDQGLWCGREYEYTAPFVLRDARTACFSAGNGLTRTGVAGDRYSSLRPTSGPSWVVTVGAVSPRNEQDYSWHSVPVDISSYGLHWPAADPFSVNGEQDFGGTSNATPVTCGVFSRALLALRNELGDTAEGLHAGPDGKSVAAAGRLRAGFVKDGVLTRQELQDAVYKTAQHEEFNLQTFTYDPFVVPDSPVYYTQEGYGVANVASAQRAIAVLLGKAPMPDRSEVDSWITTEDEVRDVVYPPPHYD